MGAVYGRAVMAGTRTLESIHEMWRPSVEAWLAEMGWEPTGEREGE